MLGKIVIAGFLISSPLVASQTEPIEPREAWLWTNPQRIVKRVDHTDRAARRGRELTVPGRLEKGFSTRSARQGFSPINGVHEPELFLPVELLRVFVGATDRQSAAGLNYRRRFRSEIARANWDYEQFWALVDREASSYNSLFREAEALQKQFKGKAELGDRPDRLCAEQARMLGAFYAELGEGAFNQLLYSTIAPGLMLWTDDAKDTKENLERTDRGCR